MRPDGSFGTIAAAALSSAGWRVTSPVIHQPRPASTRALTPRKANSGARLGFFRAKAQTPPGCDGGLGVVVSGAVVIVYGDAPPQPGAPGRNAALLTRRGRGTMRSMVEGACRRGWRGGAPPPPPFGRSPSPYG